VIADLNPKEANFDKRNLKEGEEVETKLQEIGGQVVHAGEDKKFNLLRVLPPCDYSYPDFNKEKETFYDVIGCPHLKEKYAF